MLLLVMSQPLVPVDSKCFSKHRHWSQIKATLAMIDSRGKDNKKHDNHRYSVRKLETKTRGESACRSLRYLTEHVWRREEAARGATGIHQSTAHVLLTRVWIVKCLTTSIVNEAVRSGTLVMGQVCQQERLCRLCLVGQVCFDATTGCTSVHYSAQTASSSIQDCDDLSSHEPCATPPRFIRGCNRARKGLATDNNRCLSKSKSSNRPTHPAAVFSRLIPINCLLQYRLFFAH